MSFQSNPLSLSVPEPAFESWLRESGFLELLDHRTTQLHHLHSSTASTAPTTALPPRQPPSRTTATTTLTTLIYTLTMSLISSLATFLSVFSVNPFAKLDSSDFSGSDDILSLSSWTNGGFLGELGSYSYPFSPTQARMRVYENVKRFAKHYAVLSAVFFACSLYQMPVALIGLLSCLALWELFRFCDAKWMLERFPSSRQVLIRAFQCVVAAILFWCNVQTAIFWTVAVSYAVLIMHASFRKLTPANSKQPPQGRGR